MGLVLLFYTWLTLCYSSLSANGTNTFTPQTCISIGPFIAKETKSSVCTKIKFHSTKVRLFFSERIVFNVDYKIKNKVALQLLNNTLGWNISENFKYQSIFSYLHPKRAFW